MMDPMSALGIVAGREVYHARERSRGGLKLAYKERLGVGCERGNNNRREQEIDLHIVTWTRGGRETQTLWLPTDASKCLLALKQFSRSSENMYHENI
jgi:hypothetical protein